MEDYIPDYSQEYKDLQLTGVRLLQEIKPRTVIVYAENLPPNEDNIKVYFDDTQVPAEIVTQTDIVVQEAHGFHLAGEPGTTPGTVKSDSRGRVTLKFVIPPHKQVGQKVIKLKSDSGLVNTATTMFCVGMLEHWKGVKEVKKTSYVYNVWAPTPTDMSYPGHFDPIAQTFDVEKDMFLSSIEVWFHSVPPGDAGTVVVGLRPLDDTGYPKDEVLAETCLTRDEIVSQMGSESVTTPTNSNSVKISFNSPVYLPKGGYAFTIGSSIDGFTVFASEIGKQIIGSVSDHATGYIGGFPFPTGLRRILTSSAYPQGVLMKSSSGSAWVPDHKRDLMFRIYRAKFKSSGTVFMNTSVANHEFSHINHLCECYTPFKSKIKSYYSIDENNYHEYLPVQVKFSETSAEDAIALGTMTNKLKLRYELSTEDNRVSPILIRHPNQFHSLYYLENGVYRTKEVECEDFENIYVWIDEKENHGSITYEVSFDSGSTWYNLPLISSTLLKEEFYERYLGGSIDSITSSVIDTATKFIVRITFSNSLDYRYLTPIFRRLRVLTY